MHKKMRRRRELECRYWELTGMLPTSNPFRWFEPRSKKQWDDDLAAEIEDIERHRMGHDSFDIGPPQGDWYD